MPKSPPAPRARTSAQQKREALYRELILEAAESLFAERGVEASKMEDIAVEAGLSLGTVYAVFRGKPAILDGIHEMRLGDLLERATGAVHGLDSTLDMLIAGMCAYVDYFMAHPAYLQIHLREGTSWGLPLFGTSTRATAWEEGHAMQERLIARGIDEGVFYPDDPGRMARTMVAMQQVRLADWMAGGMQETPEEITAGMELQLRRAFCIRPEDRKDPAPDLRSALDGASRT